VTVRVYISTVADKTMFIPEDRSNQVVADNRKTFLEQHDIVMAHATRVNITYDRENFCEYREVNLEQDGGLGMTLDDSNPADALITKDSGHALFLPLADCVGAVLFDPAQHILMVTHLGRHSVEQHGGEASINHLVTTYGSQPNDILVWLTPAPGKDKYPMWAFDNQSIKDVVMNQLVAADVQPNNITDNTADTTTDQRYFSHSEYLAGRRSEDGRYAVIAVME